MGISVSFSSKKATHAHGTHMSYTTMHRILEACGLPTHTLQSDYGVSFPAKKVISAMQDFLSREHRKTVRIIDWAGNFLDPQLDKEYVFVKQIVAQYNEMCKAGVKPTLFDGA